MVWVVGVGEGVRVGGDEGDRKVGLTPGTCPRCSSSACGACVGVYACRYACVWVWVYPSFIITWSSLYTKYYRT